MKVIQLDENTNVKNVTDLKSLLIDALGGEREVLLDLSKVKRIDLATAQVLIAAGREARAASKTIKLKSVSADVRKQLSLCGMA